MSMIERLKSLLSGSKQEGAAGEMISCEEALALVHDFIDGELTQVSATEVQAHFDVCKRCYPHLKLEEAFREAVRRAAASDAAPADLRARLLERLAQADG